MSFPNRARKYGNTKVKYDGYTFDSLFECEQYKVLKRQVQAKVIADLKCQPKVYLSQARILYKPDFLFYDVKEAKWIYVDIKGMETPVFRIKLRLWKAYGPGELQVWKRGPKASGGIKVTNIVRGPIKCVSNQTT